MSNKLPYFLSLSPDDRKKCIESLIFAAEQPLTNHDLEKILIVEDAAVFWGRKADESQTDISEEIIKNYKLENDYFEKLIAEINSDLLESGRPFEIRKIGGGWQFSTRKQYGEIIASVTKSRSKKRLTPASLESLAVIAYKQPVTKPEVEQVRGVNSAEVINSLVEKGLVKMVGRKDTLGKPLLYATTEEFLKTFGLQKIEDLPKLKEIEEIIDEDIELGKMKDEIIIDVSGDYKTVRIGKTDEIEAEKPKNPENN